MNKTLFTDSNSTRVQYARHNVKGNSNTGFYMFIVTLVTVGAWSLSVILSH